MTQFDSASKRNRRLSRYTKSGEVIDAMRHDKKINLGQLRFAIPLAPGRAVIITGVSLETVGNAVRRVLS